MGRYSVVKIVDGPGYALRFNNRTIRYFRTKREAKVGLRSAKLGAKLADMRKRSIPKSKKRKRLFGIF